MAVMVMDTWGAVSADTDAGDSCARSNFALFRYFGALWARGEQLNGYGCGNGQCQVNMVGTSSKSVMHSFLMILSGLYL